MAIMSWRSWLSCGVLAVIFGLAAAAEAQVPSDQPADQDSVAVEAPAVELAAAAANGNGTEDETDEDAPVDAPAADAPALRVALVGNTFIEREQQYGYWETWLAASQPQQRFIVRNLGWSGDNVQGESRAGFGKPRDGYDKLIEQVRSVRPDVVFVAYGTNASFEGERGLSAFRSALDQLLRDLKATGARLVLVSPPPFEDAGVPGVDTLARNADLALYSGAIREAAEEWEAQHVDLFGGLASAMTPGGRRLTDNGMHLSAYGYWLSAPLMDAPLTKTQPWRLSLALEQGHLAVKQSSGTAVIDTAADLDQSQTVLSWSLRDAVLPVPTPPPGKPAAELPAAVSRVLQVQGLPQGEYELRIDRQVVATAPAEAWARGVTLTAGPDHAQVEQIRAAVIKKNELFFHRWRPQNETYLFGFRKHEQGQNAREIPQFDPLVAEMEEVIFRLSQPQRRYYELRRLAN